MKSRLNDVPSLREIHTVIAPQRFNSIRLGLLRLGAPLRIELDGLRHLDMLLDDDAWICVDRSLNDLPVMAWTDFHTGARRGLNDPVTCRLRLFHSHAAVILNSTLEAVERKLGERLAAHGGLAEQTNVSPLPRPD